MLINDQLNSKNQFATNTIGFIDSTLISMESKSKKQANEFLKNSKRDKDIFEFKKKGLQFLRSTCQIMMLKKMVSIEKLLIIILY